MELVWGLRDTIGQNRIILFAVNSRIFRINFQKESVS